MTLTTVCRRRRGHAGQPARRVIGVVRFGWGVIKRVGVTGVVGGPQNTSSTGSWPTATSSSGYAGYNYQTHAAGTGTDTFTWHLNIPADGNYTVYVRYPAVSGAATNASYKVTYSNGTGGTATATVTEDQTKNASTQTSTTWVALGKWAFTQSGTGQQVSLAENSGGTVVADAVRVVRDNSGDNNIAHHHFTYNYDPNGNLTGITDSSPSTAVANYSMTYDGLNELTKVEEDNSSGAIVHTTTYGYDAARNLISRGHDSATSTYIYNSRNLLATETDAASSNDPSPQVTTFAYNPLGLAASQVKPNSNTVTYNYFADRLLQSLLRGVDLEDVSDADLGDVLVVESPAGPDAAACMRGWEQAQEAALSVVGSAGSPVTARRKNVGVHRPGNRRIDRSPCGRLALVCPVVYAVAGTSARHG